MFKSLRPSPPESLNKASVSLSSMFLEAKKGSIFKALSSKVSKSPFVKAFKT